MSIDCHEGSPFKDMLQELECSESLWVGGEQQEHGPYHWCVLEDETNRVMVCWQTVKK